MGTKFQSRIMKKVLERDGWLWLKNNVNVPETMWIPENCTCKNGKFYVYFCHSFLKCPELTIRYYTGGKIDTHLLSKIFTFLNTGIEWQRAKHKVKDALCLQSSAQAYSITCYLKVLHYKIISKYLKQGKTKIKTIKAWK